MRLDSRHVLLLALLAAVGPALPAEGQVLNRLRERAQQRIERELERKVDEKAAQALDAVLNAPPGATATHGDSTVATGTAAAGEEDRDGAAGSALPRGPARACDALPAEQVGAALRGAGLAVTGGEGQGNGGQCSYAFEAPDGPVRVSLLYIASPSAEEASAAFRAARQREDGARALDGVGEEAYLVRESAATLLGYRTGAFRGWVELVASGGEPRARDRAAEAVAREWTRRLGS